MRMKIYKYVRLRDNWATESSGRGGRVLAEKGGTRRKGLESGGRRKRRKRFD